MRTWLLTVVTFGVYAVWHHHEINRELRDFGVEVRPAFSALALFPGALVVVPAFVTVWRTSRRLAVAQETVGLTPTALAGRSLIAIAFALFVPYHQREANRVWWSER